MLHIFLLILKILLWILLGIIGLALLLILLVLFAPVRYKLDVSYHDTANVKAKVNFLCVSVAVMFSQSEKKLDKAIRIFGIKLGGHKKKNKPEKESKKTSKKESKKDDTVDKIPVIEIAEEAGDSKLIDFDEEDEADLDIEETEKAGFLEKIKKLALKLSDLWKKLSAEDILDLIDEKSDKLEKKITKLEKKINKFKKFWNLKCTVKTRAYLKKYLISVLKHISPRKIRGYVNYGFGDPSKTGEITGYLSMLPFVYQKGFTLSPDFYNKNIDAEVKLKGRIRLGYIIRIVLKPYIWRTLKVARKLK